MMARAIEVTNAELATIPDWRDPIGGSLQTQASRQAVALLPPSHQAVLLQIHRHDRRRWVRSGVSGARRWGLAKAVGGWRQRAEKWCGDVHHFSSVSSRLSSRIISASR
jgi:hypothetical protein